MKYGTQKAQLGGRGQRRLPVQRQQPHFVRELLQPQRHATRAVPSKGPNTENNFYYYNNRLQFIEEGLISSGPDRRSLLLSGLANSRIDWRVNFARANRDEPDLRETLYQAPFIAGTLNPNLATPPVLADESQSGFRLFNNLDDETIDAAFNWSMFKASGARPTQYKFGVNYVDRTRDFESRRFRFIPVVLSKIGSAGPAVQPDAAARGAVHARTTSAPRSASTRRPARSTRTTATRPPGSAYGMVDIAFSARTRLNGRRPGRALRPDRQHLRPVRPVRPHRLRPRTRTPTSFRRSTSCSRLAATRTSA